MFCFSPPFNTFLNIFIFKKQILFFCGFFPPPAWPGSSVEGDDPISLLRGYIRSNIFWSNNFSPSNFCFFLQSPDHIIWKLEGSGKFCIVIRMELLKVASQFKNVLVIDWSPYCFFMLFTQNMRVVVGAVVNLADRADSVLWVGLRKMHFTIFLISYLHYSMMLCVLLYPSLLWSPSVDAQHEGRSVV